MRCNGERRALCPPCGHTAGINPAARWEIRLERAPVVIHIRVRYLVSVVLFVFLVPAFGQESRQFYKKPETVAEFWRAMNHEIEVGQSQIAAGYLKGFLAQNPSDEDLLQIQDREGSAAFGRLLAFPELRADAKPLVERVDALVQKHLSD